MKKVIEVPMKDLTDLLNWHESQVARYTNLQAKHTKTHAGHGKYGASIIRSDQYRAEFHQRAVDILKAAMVEVEPVT